MKQEMKDILKEEGSKIESLITEWNNWFYKYYPAHTGKICMNKYLLFGSVYVDSLTYNPYKYKEWDTSLNALGVIYVVNNLDTHNISKTKLIDILFEFLNKKELLNIEVDKTYIISENIYQIERKLTKQGMTIKEFVQKKINEEEKHWLKIEDEPFIHPKACGAREALEAAGIDYSKYQLRYYRVNSKNILPITLFF